MNLSASFHHILYRYFIFLLCFLLCFAKLFINMTNEDTTKRRVKRTRVCISRSKIKMQSHVKWNVIIVHVINIYGLEYSPDVVPTERACKNKKERTKLRPPRVASRFYSDLWKFLRICRRLSVVSTGEKLQLFLLSLFRRTIYEPLR